MGEFAHKDFYVVAARHPQWNGHLLLAKNKNMVVHKEYGSTGAYSLLDSTLIVKWNAFPQESFRFCDGVFVHDSLPLPDLTQASYAAIYGQMFPLTRFCVKIPGADAEVTLRSGTTDLPTFAQIFIRREYHSPYLPGQAANILDLGANIGLSAVYFASLYPQARLVCVEPDAENFALLTANVAAFGERVRALHGAVWSQDGAIRLKTRSDSGEALGAWGVQVTDSADSGEALAPAFSLPTLLGGIEGDVDILKVDIEGAELDVFDSLSDTDLDRVRLIAIETHDRFRPDSEAVVRKRVKSCGFIELPQVGENLFFRRT